MTISEELKTDVNKVKLIRTLYFINPSDYIQGFSI
ncbi:hypothetical protein ZPR_0903 [Zunongwangia profunda SM-A87]|uniref:Uncharacterized protein n=1 Tax=Zunongwangia profunda (strain DSM 18752 / CCTCC AB 206139 / SM-A87) TaxID=655815 RepID=D5BH76_ZUNPS|nr:hypothetical protein ZPR_0903 [Zunongwangia profunda SM-A87]